jgi:methyl-accepting chemotaxis protein
MGMSAENTVQILRAVGSFLHEAQRERGVSAVHVKSGRRLFASEIAVQRSRTDVRRRNVAALALFLGPSVLPDTPAHLERIAGLMETVSTVRGEIERRAVTAARVIEAFSALNTELLSAVDAYVTRVTGEDARCLALASLALLHAKEKTGIERARLGTAFVGTGPDEADRLAIAELIAARTSYLHMYAATAPTAAAQMLRRGLAAPPAVEVRRIEDRIFARDAHTHANVAVDAGTWFSTITRKIEMLGDVANLTLSYFPAV